MGKLFQLLSSWPALLISTRNSSLFCSLSGESFLLMIQQWSEFQKLIPRLENVRPFFCLKALGSPSVPHPAAKLRIQRRVVSSCHVGGLPCLFSVGNASLRKHLTSLCFASAVEGRSKPALHLCAFYLPSVLEGVFFPHIAEEAMANVSEMG